MLAVPISVSLPIIKAAFDVAFQCLLSIALASGHYVGIKPHIPSQAESSCMQMVANISTQKFLQDVSTQTGILINPEFLTKLNAAGMHHDFTQLADLLAHVQPVNHSNSAHFIKEILDNKQTELNPYALVPGMKAFAHDLKYPADVYSHTTAHSLNQHAQTIPLIELTGSYHAASATQTSFIPKDTLSSTHHNGEPLFTEAQPIAIAHASPNKTQQLILQQTQATESLGYQNQESMRRLLHHHTDRLAQADAQDFYEFQNAVNSVAPHMQNPALRTELARATFEYQKVIADACKLGASAESITAHTKIATQGLPLPGFLQGFSDALQEKVAALCFDKQGNWRGIETIEDLEKIKQAAQPFNEMLAKLSGQLAGGRPELAHRCAEELYTMDQGWGNIFVRLFKPIGSFFNPNAVSYPELKSRILQNPYNNQVFTALELLNKKEFKLARLPLEHMNASCKSSNSVLLHQQLLQHYQQRIQSIYGSDKVPLAYQNDPVYWLYKPTLATMQEGDSRINVIHGHLALRDSIYQELNHRLNGTQAPSAFMQHLMYGMIDKLNDPLALVDHVQHLNSNSPNADVRNACAVIFDKGVLKLFDLKKQAHAYGISLPDSINLQENSHLRSAANKLLLIDAHTESAQRSLKLGLESITHACTHKQHAKEYSTIALAITQAHTQAGSSTGSLALKAIPVPQSLTDDLNQTILTAASKAAHNDLARVTDLAHTSPLTNAQAWACINEVQTLAEQGKIAHAKALAETYLQGFIDEQMPWKKHMYRALGAAAITSGARAGILWATSGDQHKQLPRVMPQGPPQKSNLPDDENDEEEKKLQKAYDDKIEELRRTAKKNTEKDGGVKIYEKNGSYEDALNDLEKVNPKNITNMKNGKIGKYGDLPNNKTITVRLGSSDSRPTLEIYDKITKKIVFKIRYGMK